MSQPKTFPTSAKLMHWLSALLMTLIFFESDS